MRPFPLAVQTAFPCSEGRFPKRPWWAFKSSEVVQSHPNRELLKQAEGSDEAESVDVRHPIPHPGYRAGQIWASEDGQSITILSVNRQGVPTPSVPVTRLASEYPFLVADPACPQCAPWSPAETV